MLKFENTSEDKFYVIHSRSQDHPRPNILPPGVSITVDHMVLDLRIDQFDVNFVSPPVEHECCVDDSVNDELVEEFQAEFPEMFEE